MIMLREFHDGMKARIVVGGEESDSFEVLAGVKQGCVLTPIIFNLFLVAVTLVFRNGLSNDVRIPYKYRLDGSMFNLRRLQAQTKVSLTLCLNFNMHMMQPYRVTSPQTFRITWALSQILIKKLA